MSDGIILGGKRYECRAPVLTWEEHGMEFKIGRGARRRVEEIDLFVWHWTGGENEPPTMYRTLEKRKLGVEFAITRAETTPGYATIYQFADPLILDTFDAGYVNRVSMGCEVINYGWRRLKNLGRIPKRGRDRERYKTLWNGRRPTYARFYPHQLHSVLALADAVCDSGVTKIEKRVPRAPAVTPRGVIGREIIGEPVEDLLRRPMTKDELIDFHGHIGHNHVTKKKSDPGTDLLQHLMINGYA